MDRWVDRTQIRVGGALNESEAALVKRCTEAREAKLREKKSSSRREGGGGGSTGAAAAATEEEKR